MIADLQRIAVTGANGFVGSNLVLQLQEQGHQVHAITRNTSSDEAHDYLAAADVVFHVAGASRCDDDAEFYCSNRDYSAWVARAVTDSGRKPLVVYSSSVKALEETPYGRSKLAGENAILDLASTGRAIVSIWRLPSICGKWSRPNYNSVVATFCHNVSRGLPVRIDDRSAPLSLLYVDDLIDQWLALIGTPPHESGYREPEAVYQTTVGEIADLVHSIRESRSRSEVLGEVGNGLTRIVYASYVAAMPVTDASYPAKVHTDSRGSFVEVLTTATSGQISYFSTHPGRVRGGHYHHSKIEKFLVAHGTGRFRFQHVRSGEYYELVSSASEPLMIETIPGWTHDVTNVGDDELIVLTWANERFDPERADTHVMPL